jgi:hypothetical protein
MGHLLMENRHGLIVDATLCKRIDEAFGWIKICGGLRKRW